MKKAVCRVLAFIMTVSVFVINRSATTEVAAAFVGDGEFRYHNTDTIDLATFERRSNRVPSSMNEVVMAWPAATAARPAMDGGTYVLEYAYKDDQSVKVEFDMSSNGMIVRYQLLDKDGNAANLFSVDTNDINAPVRNLRYYELGASKVMNLQNGYGGFVITDITTVQSSMLSRGTMAFTVYSSETPLTEIETIKIVWGLDDWIYYSTNKANPSQLLYDFTLRGKTAASKIGSGAFDYVPLNGAAGKTLQVSTGYSVASPLQIKTYTTADGGDVIDKTLDPPPTVWPGENPVIHFEIRIPQKWDEATGKFVNVEESDNVGAEFTLGDSTVSFKIGNLLNPASVPTNENYEYIYDTTATPKPDFGYLRIKNRGTATVYNGAYFRILTDGTTSDPFSIIHGDTTQFGAYDVHTPIAYEIIQPDIDNYSIRITNPFKFFNQSGVGSNIYGVYTIYRAMSMGADERVAGINVQLGSNDYSEMLTVPIPLTTHDVGDPVYYYRVDFTPTGTSADYILRSQSVKYFQENLMDVLQVPQDFTISQVDTITARDSSLSAGSQDYARYSFSFTTGYDEILRNMAKPSPDGKGIGYIDYYFYADETPKSSTAEHRLTLRVYLDSTIPAKPGVIVKGAEIIKVGADTPDPNIKLVDFNYSTAERRVGGNLIDFGTIEAEVIVPVVQKADTSQTSVAPVFSYPGNYYARLRGVYNVPAEQKTTQTTLSSEAAFNISAPAVYEVTAPSSFRAARPTTDSSSSFDLSWSISVAGIFNYMDFMLNPSKLTFHNLKPGEPSLTYGVYIGQSFDNMKALAEGIFPSSAIRVRAIDTEAAGWNGSIDVSKLDTDALEFIREGGIYLVNGLVQKDFTPENVTRNNAFLNYGVKLTGLDDNTGYFASVRTELIPYETRWDPANPIIGVPEIVGSETPIDERHPYVADGTGGQMLPSKTASIASYTTTVDVTEPSPDEFEPPAPVALSAEKSDDGADVYWNRLQQAQLPEGVDRELFEYEIIRVKSNSLSDNIITNKGTLSEVLAYIRSNYQQMELAAWRTDLYETSGEPALEELTGNSSVHEGDVSFIKSDVRNTLADGSAQPGTMYVYYVRTIQKIDKASTDDNNISKYSVWTRISVTTDTLKGPVNLKAVAIGDYDLMTEAYVSFDAPVPIADITSGAYTLSYSIKSDQGDWGPERTITPSSLEDGITSVSEPEGYYKYYYTVTGLEPGNGYYIRVRITDNETSDKSKWSNELSYRTEFDPDKPEDESDKWLDYFKQKLEELLKKPYWTIRSNQEAAFEAVYRDSMIEGVIGAAADGVITLGREGVREQIYYIPAKSFAKIVAADKDFKIVSQNVTELIPSSVIGSDTTQAVRDILAQINSNTIKDYYVRLSLALAGTSEKINGNNALTDRITISIKTVGFKELELLWDTDITSKFKVAINDESHLSQYNQRIINAVNQGSSNEELVRLVDTLVAEFERDFDSEVSDSFSDKRQYEYEASSFATPVRIAAVPAAQAGQTSISGYQLVQGQWQSIPALPYGTGRSILPTVPGTFIFSGVTINIPGINDMQQGDAITGVAIKYGLDDYFGKGQSFNTYMPLTNDALIGSIARMAGATNVQDAAAFLRGKGVNVSTRNAYSNATNENTVYMLMSLYEIKTNTKVSSIRITNQNIVKDIPGIGANYVPYYKAAYQIGIMDKNYMPKEQMTVRDFLQILGKLAGKLKL